jgi:hypothetical protein
MGVSCPVARDRGQSRQPLSDAYRQIERLLGPTGQVAGLFRQGHAEPDLTCRVDVGAKLTTKEEQRQDTVREVHRVRLGSDTRMQLNSRRDFALSDTVGAVRWRGPAAFPLGGDYAGPSIACEGPS